VLDVFSLELDEQEDRAGGRLLVQEQHVTDVLDAKPPTELGGVGVKGEHDLALFTLDARAPALLVVGSSSASRYSCRSAARMSL
jgi:hypothetical protein